MKIYLLAFISTITYSMSAQVGINISNPNGIFHINAKGINISETPTSSESLSHIIVDNFGNVGIGTVVPTAKLHLRSNTLSKAFKLYDGTEGVNRVLLGDASGNAHWGMIKGRGGEKIVFENQRIDFSLNVEQVVPINTPDNVIEIPTDGAFAFLLRWTPRFMHPGITSLNNPDPSTIVYSNMVIIEYALMLKRSGQIDSAISIYQTRPYMQYLSYHSFLEILVGTDLKKDDKVYLTAKVLNVGASNSAYLTLDPNDPSSIESTQAFNSSAIIFYKL